jgi:SNARE protein 1
VEEVPSVPIIMDVLRMLTCWVLLMQILDSTERAVEHSLASTGRATARASEVYSLASKTTCFQWLLIFMMTCMFVMVVLLIRVT